MIVQIINTGEKREVSATYGTRLIEQGVAVAVPANNTPAEAPAPKKGKAAGDA